MRSTLPCWCGASKLAPFSAHYRKCEACGTLVTADTKAQLEAKVTDDKRDFYGRDYWFSHQEKDLGFPNIVRRARADLPERCLHWLKTLLKYKTPPGRVLELGSAHGGFVALLDWAGFRATGLELSPWVARFARRTFSISQLVGPVEDQRIAPHSLDVVALLDVLEHLSRPVQTIRHCLKLLRPSGVLLIQTPQLPEGKTYRQMVDEQDPFLEQLKSNEHLYLFSRKSIQDFFRRLKAPHLSFEPAYFDHYDMFFVAAHPRLRTRPPDAIARALEATPRGRLVQALLDSQQQLSDLGHRHSESEKDRARRLEYIRVLEARLAEAEKDRAARLTVIHDQGVRLDASEADRAARLDLIQKLSERGDTLQAAEDARAADVRSLEEQVRSHERERAGQLEAVSSLSAQIEQYEIDRLARLQDIRALSVKVEGYEQDRLARLEETRALSTKIEEHEQDRRLRFEEHEKERAHHRAEVSALRAELDRLSAEVKARLERIDSQETELAALRARLSEIETSLSWRLTALPRRLRRWLISPPRQG